MLTHSLCEESGMPCMLFWQYFNTNCADLEDTLFAS